MDGRACLRRFAVGAFGAAVIVLGLSVYAARGSAGARRDAVEARAQLYASVAARELAEAAAAEDASDTPAVFDALLANREIRAVALLRRDGTPLALRGELGAPSAVRATSGQVVVELASAGADPPRGRSSALVIAALVVAGLALAAARLGLKNRSGAAVRSPSAS